MWDLPRLNLGPLHWQADSYLMYHQGSPNSHVPIFACMLQGCGSKLIRSIGQHLMFFHFILFLKIDQSLNISELFIHQLLLRLSYQHSRDNQLPSHLCTTLCKLLK